MQRGLFITGTDTGVGKTYIAAGLASSLRRRGIDVGVMKPAETGCPVRAGRMIPADALRLMRAARVADALDLVNPYRFRNPLAPAVAAEFDGKKIDVKRIRAAYRRLASRHEFMIVEGAGGILVPFEGSRTFIDLAAALGLPVLVVARPGLGTINHTLLTVEALKRRGLALAGIVINHSRKGKAGPAEKTNPAVIGTFCKGMMIEIVRHGVNDFDGLVQQLAETKSFGRG